MAKHTLVLTQQCNLRCRYCYVDKVGAAMPLATALRAIDFAYAQTPPGEAVDIGFFGGEPLLEFGLMRDVTAAIKAHRDYRRERVVLSVISNATLYSDEIADFLEEQEIHLCMSCDGPPDVQDSVRLTRNGKPTSALVENNLRRAAERFPGLRVNAVYGPATLRSLPRTVDYLASLGVSQIHLNPDYSAPWSAADLVDLPAVYGEVGKRYESYRDRGESVFVSLIDSKIAVILRGGYQSGERCRMGSAEFAFAPAGWIYPCERLVGAGDGTAHCIGHLDTGLSPGRGCTPSQTANAECGACGLAKHCMRWCACSNYFASGSYERVSAFLCASERAAIQTAFDVFCRAEQRQESGFFEHASGLPHADSLLASSRVSPPPGRGQPVYFHHRSKGDFSNG